MDINSITSSHGPITYQPASTNVKVRETVKLPAKSADTITFSAASLQKAKDFVYKTPEIRLPMVEKLKEKIKNNEWPIDRIINTELERLINSKIL